MALGRWRRYLDAGWERGVSSVEQVGGIRLDFWNLDSGNLEFRKLDGRALVDVGNLETAQKFENSVWLVEVVVH